MTYKEKLKQDYPYAVDESAMGGCCNCPYTYGYEITRPEFCKEIRKATDELCTMCWNREIPGTEKGFTKADLKVGHVVEYRNGNRRLVHAEGNDKFLLFIGATTYEIASIYNDNLLCKRDHNFDIMKVYNLKDSYITSGNMLDVKFNLIWERKEVRDISISDAEVIIKAATGKQVKIIK